MRRRGKTLLTLLLVAASVGVVWWNVSAQGTSPTLGVSDAKRQAEALAGQPVSVRGVVVEGTILVEDGRVVEFVVADPLEQLRVRYNRTPPDNFGAKEVVLRGHLVVEDGTPVLRAQEIHVGCASKY